MPGSIVIVIPLLVWALYRLNRNYELEETELEHNAPTALAPSSTGVRKHSVIVLVDELDVPAAQALQYARSLLPDDLMAMHIDLDPVRTTDLVEAWGRLGYTRFPLEVVDCPTVGPIAPRPSSWPGSWWAATPTSPC